ncbi:hypothetical protein HYY72_04725 [Candidatus Woesearchaeota archaeon]|nr:hypothetical protein [Candidatus Woesearchaeota archaeon]
MKSRLKRKAALDVSVNSIVVIVFAFITLAAGIFLIQTLFKGVPDIFKCSVPEPSSSDSITTCSDTIPLTKGVKAKMEIKFFNREGSEISATTGAGTINLAAAPQLTCVQKTGTPPVPTSRDVSVTASPQTVAAGATADYSAVVEVESTSPLTPGLYPCTLRISQTTKPLFLDLK